MHAHDPEKFQTQRRTGARGFVWSSAEHDDVAITRNLRVSFGQLFESEAPGAGDRFGLIERAA